MRIRFTPFGRTQFLDAVSYIQQDNHKAAVQFRKRAERVLRRLIDHPLSGRVIPEFPNLPYREVVITPYRFFYRTEGKTVWIVAVWHGAQLPMDPDALWTEEAEKRLKAYRAGRLEDIPMKEIFKKD